MVTYEGRTMHGDKKVIEQLNAALRSELTAIVQYMTQAEMCQGWGLDLTKARSDRGDEAG